MTGSEISRIPDTRSVRQVVTGLLLLLASAPALSVTTLVYDSEPNDAPHQAIDVPLPDGKDRVRIIGDLAGTDQDAYRLVVDEDEAARRVNVSLIGRSGALTRLDILEFTDLVDGRGRIPAELEARPTQVWSVESRDGTRAVQDDALLLAPGVYVLGVSHSGGEGTYEVELSEFDDSRIVVIDEPTTEESPERASTRGLTVVWAQGETWFEFGIDEDPSGLTWDLDFQTPAGRPATMVLIGPEGESLLELESDGGTALKRPGLTLAPGKHRIRTTQDHAGVQMFRIQPGTAAATEGREVEPNDSNPTPIPFGETITGRFDEDDTDWVSFIVDEPQSARRYRFELRAADEASIEVCLRRLTIGLNQCVRGDEGLVQLHSLGLTPGEYQMRMYDRASNVGDWQLSWTDLGPVEPGQELEPNDEPDQSVAMHERGFGRGRFEGGRDIDHWRFSVTGDPQLWRMQLQGDDLFEFSLMTTSGKTLASARGSSPRIRLDNLFLMPGDYVLAAQGRSGDYMVRTQPLGPPPPGMEIEPNDTIADARRMHLNQEYVGTLAQSDDVDRYRFSLQGPERILLTVQPPADGGIRGQLGVGNDAVTIKDIRNGNAPGEALNWDVFLPAGDYVLTLEPGQVSDAEYSVQMTRGDWLDEKADREPNDVPDAASPLPRNGRVDGQVGTTHASSDWYRIDPVTEATTLEWPKFDGVRFEAFAADDPDEDALEFDRDRGLHILQLQPGLDYFLEASGRGTYELDLSVLTDGAMVDPDWVEVAIELDTDRVQAFSAWAQRIDGELVLTHSGAAPVELDLEAHLTDMRWQVSGLPDRLELNAGAVRRLPFSLVIAPDAVSIPPVQLSVNVGGIRTTRTIEPAIDVVPVRPMFHWPLPEQLRGGFNAAALRFGATAVASPNIDADDIDEIEHLMDGLASYGRWTEYTFSTRGDSPAEFAQPTIRLAGEDPVPVRGFLLNPTSTILSNRFLADFEIEISVDGENFTPVLRDRLEPLSAEQAFVLDAPVEARYVRIKPLTASQGSARGIGTVSLGEFKVVAEHGWRPQPEPINVADPALGGHLVWGDPWIRGSASNTGLLVAGQESPSPRIKSRATADAVIAFENSRAARVQAFSIRQVEPGSGQVLPTAVRILAADTPVGPWRPLTEATLEDVDTAIQLEEAVWARYLRFSFALPEGAGRAMYPDRIQVFEADGASVVGEWGHLSSHGPMEAETTPEWSGLTGPPQNRSRDSAITLAENEPAPGRALLDSYSSWYRLDVPADRPHLVLTLTGQPTQEASPRLVDSQGTEIALYPLDPLPDAEAGQHAWEAWPEPGTTVFVEAFEPPRSVIFSWDTSGSVAAWLPIISNALMTYAETIKPGRDEVNLLPFGRSAPLLSDWEGHAYPLMRMLTAYPEETSSSDAEGTLAVAAREMVGRPGKKAVIFLTDAATSTDPGLWPALRDGRPQVFAMKLSSEGALSSNSHQEIDLMQDWSRVRGGHFEYVTGIGSLGNGFDRAVARLKRPVDFSVRAAFDAEVLPAPATVRVSGGESGLAPEARGAVEIILDASGSMLKRMGGARRIEIAKAAIRRTIEETVPAGLPLALRVYGHREAGSCRTDLEIPMGPLDKAAFLEQVDAIQAVNLARTPIADSLKAVADDLSGAEGRKLVILLTDGEETCDGDPAAEILALQESGFDVRVNIVGFAIDDDALKQQFAEWAELGGGSYLDADEAEALGDALDQSLSVPFVVLDAGGDEIARGRVDGDAVDVPPGSYSVRIETATPRVVHDVSLAPGEAREIEVD